MDRNIWIETLKRLWLKPSRPVKHFPSGESDILIKNVNIYSVSQATTLVAPCCGGTYDGLKASTTDIHLCSIEQIS